jgi:hypothetical protein
MRFLGLRGFPSNNQRYSNGVVIENEATHLLNLFHIVVQSDGTGSFSFTICASDVIFRRNPSLSHAHSSSVLP